MLKSLLLALTLLFFPTQPVVKPPSPKEVVVFLPYWAADKATPNNVKDATQVYYFAVTPNADGSLNKNYPGWNYLSEIKAKNLGKRLGITVASFDQNIIAQNINNSIRRSVLTNSLIALMKSYGFSDLNIDWEYTGTYDPNLKIYLTQTVAQIAAGVHQEIPGSQVTMDILPNMPLADLKELGKVVDRVVIMAYDFHRQNSTYAGAVSPYDEVATLVDTFLENIPAEKIILGLPFYGYEWPTLSREKNSLVVKSPRTAEISSYRRSVDTAASQNIAIQYDEKTKTPWFSYYDLPNDTFRQVWFENEESLAAKLDLIREKSLAGVAFFALGYDSPELWKTVKQKLN